jgi:predicted permease
MLADLRLGLRRLVKERWFTATAAGVLALGIAATNTVFTIVNGVLLRDMPFHEPDRVVEIGVNNLDTPQNARSGVSYLDLQDWQAATRTFTGIGAADQRGVAVSDAQRPTEQFVGAYVSHNSFALIGVRPLLGRDFSAGDDQAGAPPVAILAEQVWRIRYGSNPQIPGTTIRINGSPATVIGVMPGGFGFPQNADLWLPLAQLPAEERAARGSRFLDGYARLRPGVTIEQASAELDGILRTLGERYPETNRNRTARIEPFRSGIGGPIAPLIIALLSAVGVLLLIACANVANLLLARAAERTRDVSVRLTLGASRGRIVRELLMESLLLAAAGGALGLAVSYAAIRWFRSIAVDTQPPFWMQFPLDARVFAVLTAVCLATAVLCGLVPALQISRVRLAAALNDGSRAIAGSRGGRRWTGAFLTSQVALSLVLLTGAGLIMHNLLSLVRVDAGVDITRLVRLRLDLPVLKYDTPERRLVFYQELEQRLTSASGVEAAVTTNMPLDGASVYRLQLDDGSRSVQGADVSVLPIGERYFTAIGAPLRDGRSFAPAERDGAQSVAIVNEQLAAAYFGGQSPIGRSIRLAPSDTRSTDSTQGRWLTVVGVARNIRQRILDSGEFDPVVYLPYSANPPARATILARSAADVGAAASFVREQVRAVDSDLPLFDIATVEEARAFERWPQRVFGSMFAMFAASALVLASFGLYAVTAYGVSRRTREIGVRVALGADSRRVWWAVTRPAIHQLALGLMLGLAGATAVSQVIPAMLAGTPGADPVVLGAVVALLVTAGMLACYLPARRAMRVDPMAALRTE